MLLFGGKASKFELWAERNSHWIWIMVLGCNVVSLVINFYGLWRIVR